jgi:hypothetical protein
MLRHWFSRVMISKQFDGILNRRKGWKMEIMRIPFSKNFWINSTQRYFFQLTGIIGILVVENFKDLVFFLFVFQLPLFMSNIVASCCTLQFIINLITTVLSATVHVCCSWCVIFLELIQWSQLRKEDAPTTAYVRIRGDITAATARAAVSPTKHFNTWWWPYWPKHVVNFNF